jgi:predicted CXXCH cytochrome family protein
MVSLKRSLPYHNPQLMHYDGKIWEGFLFAAGIFLLSQCSPSGKSLLTFFFDGVPESDSTRVELQRSHAFPADSANLVADDPEEEAQTLFIHYPYEEKECGACHDPEALGSMIEPQPGLCYTCHEDLNDKFQYLHGPVAGGYCTSCHDPHMSEQAKLLRLTGEELCFYCHQAESVFRNEIHEGLEGMTCTDCHNPHGGEDRYILQ